MDPSVAQARFGGDLSAREQSRVLVARTAFNRSRADAGGSLHAEGSQITCHDCALRGHRARLTGGAVAVRSGARVEMFGSRVEGCSAGESGGGWHVSAASKFICTDCVFERNAAASKAGGAGALVGAQAVATLLRCRLTANSAFAGGGVALLGCSSSSVLSLAASVVELGAATQGAGIADLPGDSASSAAGVPLLLLAGVTFRANRATSRGGALFFGAQRTTGCQSLNLTRVRFEGNAAPTGTTAFWDSLQRACDLRLPALCRNCSFAEASDVPALATAPVAIEQRGFARASDGAAQQSVWFYEVVTLSSLSFAACVPAWLTLVALLSSLRGNRVCLCCHLVA